MIGPVSAAVAAELIVVLAIFIGASVIVNGHTLIAWVVGVVQ